MNKSKLIKMLREDNNRIIIKRMKQLKNKFKIKPVSGRYKVLQRIKEICGEK